MWEWISEHWEFSVGTAIGVIGLVVGVWALFQRRPKRLDYDIVSKLLLIHERARQLDQLKVTYGGQPIEDPRVIVIRIRNTGKRAVTEEDFKGGQPITIRYKQNPYISAELTDASPGLDLAQFALVERLPGPNGEAGTGPISITPRLLNPGEWFDVQLISDGRPLEIHVTSRFADQSRPMQSELHRRRMVTKVLTIALFAATLAAAAMLFYLLTLMDAQVTTPVEVEVPRGPLTIILGLVAAMGVLMAVLVKRVVKFSD